MLGCKENMVFYCSSWIQGDNNSIRTGDSKKKKKSIIISVVGPWCGQCGHFPGKIILSFQKKKKTTPQAWFGIFKLNVHQDASWHVWIKFEIFLSNASGLFRKKLGFLQNATSETRIKFGSGDKGLRSIRILRADIIPRQATNYTNRYTNSTFSNHPFIAYSLAIVKKFKFIRQKKKAVFGGLIWNLDKNWPKQLKSQNLSFFDRASLCTFGGPVQRSTEPYWLLTTTF